jgi:phosphoribosylamine--glycine ligase
MVASQDNKRRFDNDRGPNTGGMGAISPPAIYETYKSVIEKTIVEPLLKALKKEAIHYQGVLYLGLLLDQPNGMTSAKPKILEFNARFGDPEIEVVLPRLDSDLLPVLWACTEGRLNEVELKWTTGTACCVMAVTKNYPEQSSHGQPITFPIMDHQTGDGKVIVFHFGTKVVNDLLVTAGGRIFAVTALAPDLESAAKRAYNYIAGSHFEDIDYRKDIAQAKPVSCRSEAW